MKKSHDSLQNQPYADLHIHSTYSDGLLTPAEIVNVCIEAQIKIIAITDHDSISGVKETIEAAGNKIEVIPAVEMSSNIEGLEIHILGYYIDCENEELLSYCDDFKIHRLRRVKKIVEKLSQDGINLDLDQIVTTDQSISLGRPHVARALLKNGYVRSINEAFARFLGYHSPYYVPKKSVHPREVIKKIKDWNGVSIIAHPGTINNEDIICQLITDDGASGLEVWYPESNARWQKRLYQMASKHGLLMTGGSDFHGFRGKYTQIGKFGCSKEHIVILKQTAYRFASASASRAGQGKTGNRN